MLTLLFSSAATLLCAGGAKALPVDGDGEARKVAVGTKVGNRVPQFRARLADLSSEKETLRGFDSHKTARPTAYVFVSQSCPYVRQYRGRIKDLATHYAAKGVDFVMVFPMRSTGEDSKKKFHRDHLAGSFLNDKNAAVAKALGVTETPEVVLTSKDGVIVFRGGIDDSPGNAKGVKHPHAANALNDHVAGKPVRVTKAPLYG